MYWKKNKKQIIFVVIANKIKKVQIIKPLCHTREEQNITTFNLTYYPVFQNAKIFLAELHLFLTPDVAHKASLTNVPIIDFKNDRSLKDDLVRAVLRCSRKKRCRLYVSRFGGGGLIRGCFSSIFFILLFVV